MGGHLSFVLFEEKFRCKSRKSQQTNGERTEMMMMMDLFTSCIFLRVSQMRLEEFGHTESSNFLGAENGLHLFVRCEILLVIGILKFVFLEIGPHSLHHFGTRKLFSFLDSK